MSTANSLSIDAQPIRRSARSFKKTANEEEIEEINQQLRSLSIEAHRHKAANTVTKYTNQESRLLSLPSEIRTTIYEYVLTGQNADEAKNYSFIQLPAIVITCKQFLAEMPPVFYKANTFTFAVGANLSRSNYHAQELKMLSGVLGLRARQRKAALAGDSRIRLCSVNLKVWDAVDITEVRRNITASRKGATKTLWQRSIIEARLEIVGNELTLRRMDNAHWATGWWTRTKHALQTRVDEMNERGGLERGLTLVDLMWLAKALRFDVEAFQTLETQKAPKILMWSAPRRYRHAAALKDGIRK